MAPIGVFLPTGVGLEIDGVAVSRVPFSNCLPQICLARAEASPETLDRTYRRLRPRLRRAPFHVVV